MRLFYSTILAAVLLAAAAPARGESFAAWAAKGDKLQKKGDAEGAVGAYSQALKLWRKKDGKAAKAKVLASRAALYERSRSFSEAVADLVAAAAISTRTASYFYRAGRDYLELNQPSEAITYFYKATRLNLNYKEAYYDRARAYEATGDPQFAREDYKTACRLGVKAACGRGAALKSGAKPAAPAVDEFALPAEAKPRGPVEVRRKAPRVVKASVQNFSACLAGLNQCVEDGGTFGDCVGQAAVCEKGAKSGCCPENCVKSFKVLVNSKSEAESFREVFKPKSACLAGKAERPVEEKSADDKPPTEKGDGE